MKYYDVFGDGACFFRSISYLHFPGDQHRYTEIKDIISSYLDQNQELIAFCEIQDLEEYKKTLYRRSYWGGYYEAFILSKALDINIVIDSRRTKNPIVMDNQSSKTYHLYHTGGHYMAGIPDQNEESTYLATSKENQNNASKSLQLNSIEQEQALPEQVPPDFQQHNLSKSLEKCMQNSENQQVFKEHTDKVFIIASSVLVGALGIYAVHKLVNKK